MIPVRLSPTGVLLPVRLTPKGGADVVLPFQVGDGWVRMKVKAPPEGGKANAAAVETLAKAAGVSKGSVTLVAGETHRQKRFQIETQGVPRVLAALAQAMGASSEECFALTAEPAG
jgi:uncharacterized protein (TIGR00251 family)